MKPPAPLRSPVEVSDDERLLLRATCLPGDAGRAAYEAWRPGRDLRRLDDTATRLLPLLSYNLRELGVSDPDDAWLRDRGRATWYGVKRKMHAAAEAAALMVGIGVTPVITKGAALVATDVMHASARPMADVDMVVPLEAVDDVVSTLEAAGWSWLGEWPEATARQIFQAAPLIRDEYQVDLHWQPLWEPGVLTDLASRATPGRLDGVDVGYPSVADHVILLACHGVGWNVTRARWIPDLAALIRDVDDATWHQVVELARRDQVSRAVASALDVLAAVLDVGAPPDAVAELAHGPAGRLDRLSGAARRLRPRGHSVVTALEFSARRRRHPRPGATSSALRYMQLDAQVPTLRALAGFHFRHLIRPDGDISPG